MIFILRAVALAIALTLASCANLSPDQVRKQDPVCDSTAGTSPKECGGESPQPPPRDPKPVPEPKPVPDRPDKVISIEYVGIYYHVKVQCSSGKITTGASANKDSAVGIAMADCN